MKKQIARDLLDIGAVFLRPDQPFTWASGIKSPIYCDNRLTLSAPQVRKRLENAIAQLVREKYPQADAIYGEGGGVSHAAMAAFLLDKPMGYVRGSAKEHGRNNLIEGGLKAGQRVVIIEDTISTAGSALKVVDALREAGAQVLGIVSIFTYGMEKAGQRLGAANVENTSVTDFDTLVGVAAEAGFITPADVPRLMAFRDNPQDESWI